MIAAIGLFSIVIGLIGCASPPPLPLDSAHTPPFVANFNINDLENVQEYEINIKGDKAKIKAVFLTFFFFDVSKYDVGQYPTNVYKIISKNQWKHIDSTFRDTIDSRQAGLCKGCAHITASVSLIRKSDDRTLFDAIITNPESFHNSMWGEQVYLFKIKPEPDRYTLRIKLIKTDSRLASMVTKIGMEGAEHHGK